MVTVRKRRAISAELIEKGLDPLYTTAANIASNYLYSIVYMSSILLVSAILWARFVWARRSSELTGARSWMVNAEDLASNTKPLIQEATWGGVSRQKHLSPRRHVRIAARLFGVFVKFVDNALTRRVM